jgi:type II secretory pathway pseudopilin PulG
MGRLRTSVQRLRREESGFTLTELVTVLGMLVIVMTCLSYAMIAAHKAEEDMNRRFASQINARIALDQLRREVHCATAVTPAPIGTTSNVTIVLGPRCPTAASGLIVTWCTVGSGTRYALYRQSGVTCGASGRKVVDYLTSGTVFAYTLQLPTSLAFLSVTLPVNTRPESGRPDYRLADDIVLRNSVRV